MKNIHAMAGGSVGYVRGLASVRCGGVAFPLDLVRAVVKTAARMVLRRRMAQVFDGYLVTEQGPAVVSMFSKNRARHEQGVDFWACTSERQGLGFNAAGVLSGPIDAPESIAGGGWFNRWGIAEGVAITALLDREAAFDNGAAWLAELMAGEPFAGGRWLHGLGSIALTGFDMTRRKEWARDIEGVEFGGLDAPELIAAGSCVLLAVLKKGRRLAQTSTIKREAMQ